MRLIAHLCLIIGLFFVVCSASFNISQRTTKPTSGSQPKIQSADTPMLLQADELIYDNKNNKVRASGNVEVFYNKHTLLADNVIYDRNKNVLIAQGNVILKEPNGAIVKADRIRLTDDFREGFIKSLKIRTGDDASITADRATRTGGQYNHI